MRIKIKISPIPLSYLLNMKNVMPKYKNKGLFFFERWLFALNYTLNDI